MSLPDEELISAFLDDELSPEERVRAEQLLVERADLRRLLDELRGLREGLQAEHFDQLPMFVVPCYRRNLKHHPVGYPQISVASFYGSVFPAVQNFLLGCRAVGLGASLAVCSVDGKASTYA